MVEDSRGKGDWYRGGAFLMASLMIQFGPWRPDLPPSATLTTATNVLPLQGKWGPAPDLEMFSGTLGGTALGALSVQDAAGSGYWFAGDAHNLYTINNATTTWSNVNHTTASYCTSSAAWWSFAQYGDIVYASNFADEIQEYSLGAAGVFADLAGGPPKARTIAAVKNFLVAANTYDATDGARPQRVRWSGLNAPHTWTVDANTQADFQDLLGDGGKNQAVVAGLTQADAIVLQERAVWRMTYVNLPLIWEFDPVEGARGTPAPRSAVVVGGTVFYLGTDGWFACDGAQSAAIGFGKVDKTFLSEVDETRLWQITGVADVQRKLIYWAYATTSAAAGLLDRILVYSYASGEWARLEVETELLWQTASFGYTLEELDAFGTVDSIVASFDSRQWTGGTRQLSAFDSTHTLAHFSGSPMAATLESQELTLPDPGRMYVAESWPRVYNPTGGLTVALGVRNRTDESVSWGSAVTVNGDGFCQHRQHGQFLRVRLALPAAETWSLASGVAIEMQKLGWR